MIFVSMIEIDVSVVRNESTIAIFDIYFIYNIMFALNGNDFDLLDDGITDPTCFIIQYMGYLANDKLSTAIWERFNNINLKNEATSKSPILEEDPRSDYGNG